MTKQSYDVPFDLKVTAQEGISHPWLQWSGQMGDAMNTLKDAAKAMTPLDPGTSTLSDTITAWEALRAELLKIT